jgi:hypothetical protein
MAPTLLYFNSSLDGWPGYLYDTGSRSGFVPTLPDGHRPQAYRRAQDGPTFSTPVRVGDLAVVGSGSRHGGVAGKTMSVPFGFRDRTHVDLPTGNAFPALNGIDVWLEQPNPRYSWMIEVDPRTGQRLARSHRFNERDEVQGVVRGGFLVTEGNNRGADPTEILNPRSGKPTFVVARSPDDDTVIGVSPDFVAWVKQDNAQGVQLELTDLRSKTTTPIRWQLPADFQCYSGGFSPDDRWMVLAAGCPRKTYGRSLLVMVKTATGLGRIVPGSAMRVGQNGGPAWSADGHWVIWAGCSGVCFYRPGDRRPYGWNVPDGGGYLDETYGRLGDDKFEIALSYPGCDACS